ncbi:MAG: sensor histidine kinase [Bacillota bacterium]
MSLRTRLIRAFVLVALGALALSFLSSNLGLYASMMGMHHGSMASHEPMGAPAFMAAALRWSLWSGLAAFGLAGLAGALMAERITRTLRNLRDAAARLDLRDLSRRVPVEGGDEIAELATTFNRMCDRLEADERSRRQLLADTAHELRHPLAVLQGHLDLMQDGKVPLSQESLLPLQDEVIRLTRLVADLRDLSLAEVGRLSLHLSPVNPEELVHSLLTNMSPVAAAKGIELTGEVEAGTPALRADPDRLRQVLINLLANALHHTPPGGRILLRARLEGREILFSVADTGPGIDPEDLPQIFDRFYRADKSRSRGTGGSGLGLAIVRSLVELHGGRVMVESAPGQGSCFTIRLPL